MGDGLTRLEFCEEDIPVKARGQTSRERGMTSNAASKMNECFMDSFAVPILAAPADILVIDAQASNSMGILHHLKQEYPDSELYPVTNRHAAETMMSHRSQWQLIIMDILLPSHPGAIASSQEGIQLLEHLLSSYPSANILVWGDDLAPLVSIKHRLVSHQGGWVTAPKKQSWPEMKHLVKLAMDGMICWSRFLTQIGQNPDVPLNWLEVVELKFQQGLNDRAIAKRMHVSDRTVRNYWLRLQSHLEIPDHPSHDVRVQILLKLKALGLSL